MVSFLHLLSDIHLYIGLFHSFWILHNQLFFLSLLFLKLMFKYVHLGLPWWLSGRECACNAGDVGLIPGWGRSPVEDTATHSSIFAWRIPWTEEPGGLQLIGLQRVGHDWSEWACRHTSLSTLNTHTDRSIFLQKRHFLIASSFSFLMQQLFSVSFTPFSRTFFFFNCYL